MMIETARTSRRSLLTTSLALGGIALLGFSAAGNSKPAAAPATRKMVMHKHPMCGCCGKWGDAARAAGFEVEIADTRDIMAVKAKYGVPDALASCHTTIVGGYVVEGHVPLGAVAKLLRTKPKIKGIAVPGMPVGAPGMEVPGRPADPITVMAFDAAGKVRRFA
ncbi:DUF411 domain-containing protein [Sphingomonas sp.]|uniref:DUF411 domain-containing protein n=1 Tax=Sphingomonas sp. TaxID=28214 RepID=UPI00286DFA0B|nr:DUF411 domain-containing protein [Sphingomonas sp.]